MDMPMLLVRCNCVEWPNVRVRSGIVEGPQWWSCRIRILLLLLLLDGTVNGFHCDLNGPNLHPWVHSRWKDVWRGGKRDRNDKDFDEEWAR